MIWTNTQRKEYAKMMGLSAEAAEDLKSRRRGLSTGNAFDTFSLCYKNPNQWIRISDHSSHEGADWHLARMMQDIAERLEFVFKFKKQGKQCFIMLEIEL